MNKFDEAINIVKSFEEDLDLENWLPTDKAREIINGLRKEYAPTVEMTHQQAKILASYYHPEKPIRKDSLDYPDSLLMKDLTEKELTQAWLHPDTIKLVEEEK